MDGNPYTPPGLSLPDYIVQDVSSLSTWCLLRYDPLANLIILTSLSVQQTRIESDLHDDGDDIRDVSVRSSVQLSWLTHTVAFTLGSISITRR